MSLRQVQNVSQAMRSARIRKGKRSTDAKQWKAIKTLKRKVASQEIKSLDTEVVNQGVTTTPVVTACTNVAQGDQMYQREGNQIRISSIHWRGYGVIDRDVRYSFLRLVLVQDKQQIGDTAPAWTDVFEYATVVSHTALASRGRFKILYDKVIAFSGGGQLVAGAGNTGGGPQSKVINFRKKFKNLIVRYNGAASTDIQKNGLYFMCVSTDGAGDGPTGVISSRINWYDN